MSKTKEVNNIKCPICYNDLGELQDEVICHRCKIEIVTKKHEKQVEEDEKIR